MATKARKYKKVSCHTSKSAAERAQKALQRKGKTAQLRKSGKGYCLYSAGKRKKVTLRTGQTLSGTRKRRKRK